MTLVDTVNSIARLTPALLVAFSVLFITLIPFILDQIKDYWLKQFRRQIKSAILKDNLSYEDLIHVGERWIQDRNSTLKSLRVMLSDAISGEDEPLSSKAELVRSLLKQHQSREPYAELPENIGIQLARLSELNPSANESVSQLAASLSDLYSKNQLDIQKQKRFTVWGFVAGVVGVLLAILGLYYTIKT